MSDLDPRIRVLVEAARASGPTPEDRSRVRAALAARLALVPSPPTTAGAHAATVAAGVGAKLAAAGILIGAAGFGAGVFVGKATPPAERARYGIDAHALRRAHVAERMADRAPPAPPPSAAAPSPALPPPEPLPPPAAAPAAPRHLPAPPASASAGPVVAAAPPSPAANSLVEETELLREAQTSLGAGDAAAALARLDELAARHPDGLLKEERLAAHIMALCAAGKVEEARREAARFLAEAPLSIHAARVRASCARGDPGR